MQVPTMPAPRMSVAMFCLRPPGPSSASPDGSSSAPRWKTAAGVAGIATAPATVALFCPGAQSLRQPPTTARGVHQGDGRVEQALAGLLAAEVVEGGDHGGVG